MASDFGVVAYINPPSLNDVTQPELIKFETEYLAYKEKLNDMNSLRDDANKLPVASIKDCMDGPTLQALCIMGKISGAATLEQATADKVEQWFMVAHTVAPKDLSERIQFALSTVRYKQCKADPSGAALKFCLDVIKALDKNNASEIMDDPGKAKYLIDKLHQKLEPVILQARLRMKMATWTKAEKGDILFFQECVSALAVEVAQHEVAQSRMSKKRDSAGSSGLGGSKDNRKGRPKDEGETGTEKTSGKKQKRGNADNAGPGSTKEKKYKCLNSECDGNHKMRDCDKTSDEMKKKLVADYWEKKKARKVKALTSDNQNGTTKSPGEGRYHIVIEGPCRQ